MSALKHQRSGVLRPRTHGNASARLVPASEIETAMTLGISYRHNIVETWHLRSYQGQEDIPRKSSFTAPY